MDKINKIVRKEFEAVNNYILSQLSSDVDLVDEMGDYITRSGGKRIRPILVLLVAGACNYKSKKSTMLAAAIEFLHTASLLHDDVVDHSSMRRGKPTANALWGNSPSILVGDFIYSKAFQTLVKLNRLDIMEVLANATNCIAEGEVKQLCNIKNTAISELVYLDIIYRKTAKLFEAACQCSALLASNALPAYNEHAAKIVAAMKDFGKYLGMAFQLTDDILDYTGNLDSLGKNTGDDLLEGKLTLPVIYVLEKHGETPGANNLKQYIKEASVSTSNFAEVVNILNEYDAINYTKKLAKQYIAKALSCLGCIQNSEKKYLDALEYLCQFALKRYN